MAMVTRFARTTGDLSVLSATDLQVIALTVTLDLKRMARHLKCAVILLNFQRDKPTKVPRNISHHETARRKNQLKKKQNSKKKEKWIEVDFFDEDPVDALNTKMSELSTSKSLKKMMTVMVNGLLLIILIISSPLGNQNGPLEGIIEKKQEEQEYTNNADINEHSSSAAVRIACITSDFAMQNVLLQMRLELYTPDGCRVKMSKTGYYAVTPVL